MSHSTCSVAGANDDYSEYGGYYQDERIRPLLAGLITPVKDGNLC